VELQLDTDLLGDFDDNLSPDDFQIALSPGNFANLPPSAVIIRGGNSAQGPSIHNIRLVAVQTTTGYEMEVAIPWQDLDAITSPNLEIGMALSAIDNDIRGTAIQEVMMSNAPNRTWTDPTSWGTLTLDATWAYTRLLYLTDPYLYGEDVRIVQQRLFDLGYTQVGEIDGIFGSMTEDAVKVFQEDNGLEVNGVVESTTWAVIFDTND
jgi:hypothetical protein